MQADPLVAEKMKVASLIRTLKASEDAREVLQKELDDLKGVTTLSEAESKRNGHSREPVPAKGEEDA